MGKFDNYVLISDLDGTLLNDDGEISKENIDAITTFYNKGIAFVPCTGRTYSEIPEKIVNIPGIRYIIHSNGAVVYDRENETRILNCIDRNTAKTVWDIFDSFETHITFRHNGQCFVDSRFQNDASFEYYNVIVPHQIVVRDFSVLLDNFKKVSYEHDNIEVFSVFFHNYEDKVRCKKLIEQTKKLKTVEASEFNLEIMSIDAGKGSALCSLADMLGETAQDVWAMTFHSACCRILRREIELLGYTKSFTIYDDADSERLMKQKVWVTATTTTLL